MNIGRAAKAGSEIQNTLTDLYCTLLGVHTETVIGAAAALAGDQALRATCNPLPSGRNRGGPQDDLLFASEDRGAVTLWSTIRELALAAGAGDDALPDIGAIVDRLNEPHDDPLYIPISLPEQHMPQEWSPCAIPLFHSEIAKIAQRHALSATETAFALAFAVGRFIETAKETLAPELGATLAAEIMIGVSRLDCKAVEQRARKEKPYGPGGATLSRRLGEPADRQAQMGARLAKIIFDTYAKIGVRAAETTIGALAALAGERALIATGLPLPSHGYVFGDAPDVLLYGTNRINASRQKPNLWDIVTHAAMKAGAAPADLPDYIDIIKRTAASAGGANFPALSVPKEHYPLDWSPNACPKFRNALGQFAKQKGATDTEMAVALAWGIAMIIDGARDKVPPAIAAKLAMEIMVGTARMAPLAAPVSPNAQPAKDTSPVETGAMQSAGASLDVQALSWANKEIIRMLLFGYASDGRPHTPTIIAAAAALAGEQARLATGKPPPADGWIRDDDADRYLFLEKQDGARTVWDILRSTAVQAGACQASLPDAGEVRRRTLAAIGSEGFPPLSVPAGDRPRETPMASCARFREKLETIRKRIGLTNAQTAFALAFFIGSRIAAKDGMAPAQAATLALEVMAGTSRMAPLPATSPESPQPLGNAGGPEVAVADIMQMIVQGYAGKNSQHVPTLISAAAALAGEQARLATGKPTSEDGWARNEDANKLLYRGGDQGTPTLWAIVRDAALRAKSHSGNLPAMRELTDRIMMAAGSPDFPPMSVPDDYLPMDPPLSSCVRFRQKLEDIRQKNKLSYADMALALAKTIAGFIESMPPRYSPASMTTMAMEVMTGLTRFSPSKAPADMAAS